MTQLSQTKIAIISSFCRKLQKNQSMSLTFVEKTIDKFNQERASLIKQRPCSRNRHLWFSQEINEHLELDMPFKITHFPSKPIAPIFKKRLKMNKALNANPEPYHFFYCLSLLSNSQKILLKEACII